MVSFYLLSLFNGCVSPSSSRLFRHETNLTKLDLQTDFMEQTSSILRQVIVIMALSLVLDHLQPTTMVNSKVLGRSLVVTLISPACELETNKNKKYNNSYNNLTECIFIHFGIKSSRTLPFLSLSRHEYCMNQLPKLPFSFISD